MILVGSWFLLLIMLAIHPLSGKAADDAMVTTASGVQYADLVVGSGREAHPGETAMVHYTGKLTNGTNIAISSFPFGWEPTKSLKGGIRALKACT